MHLNPVYQFIADYVTCRDVHTRLVSWQIGILGLSANDFVFVPLNKLEEFSRNELGFTGPWISRNSCHTSEKITNSTKQLFYNSTMLKRFFHADYQLCKNVQWY